MASETKQPVIQSAMLRPPVSDIELAQMLLTNGNELICLLDLDGQFMYASPSYERVLGYDPSALIGRNAFELVHPEDEGFKRTRWNDIGANEKIAVVFRHRHANGAWRWLDAHGNLTRWNDVPCVIGVAHDITAQRVAEAELRDSEARYHAAATIAFDAITILRSVRNSSGTLVDFEIVDVNKRAESLFGMSRAQLIGQRICTLLPVNRTASFFDAYAQVIESGQPLDREFSFASPFGEVWLHHQVIPLGDGLAVTNRNSTERKHAEQERERLLAATEAARAEAEHMRQANQAALALLDTLFTTAPIGLGFFDRDLRFARINQALAEINGLSAEAHLGRSLDEVLPNMSDAVLADFRRVLVEGKALVNLVVQGETPAAPGVLRTWLSSYYPVFAPDLVPVGVGVVVSEITEQKRAEAEQHKFAELVQNSADLIAIASLDGHVEFMNTAGQRLTETASLEEAQHTTMVDYFPPDQHTRMVDEVLPTVLRDGAWEGELLIRSRRTHKLIPVKTTIFVLVDPTTKQPTGFASVTRDIRHYKQVERRLRLLAEASAFLGGSLHYETALVEVARLVARRLGGWCVIELGSHERAPATYAAEHRDPAKQAEFRQRHERRMANNDSFMQRLLADDQAVLLQAEAAAASDAASTTSLICAPLLLQEQRLGAITIGCEEDTIFDADDLQLASELAIRTALAIEHARLYREAQAAIGIRDQFMSIASHELKTPLTSVLGNLQLLQRRLTRQNQVTERDQRTLRVAIEQAQRMNQLISTLLDISRIQSGQLSIERKPLDIVALARRIVEETQPIFEQHAIYFFATAESAIIDGDAVRLEQVLYNLLQNAVKYSPGGGRIEMSLQRTETQVELAVRDHGIGIPKDALPHLFERFYRAANVEAQNLSGIGIGLFVVREIVMLHGGDVSATSDGGGSTFIVHLPLQNTAVLLDTSPAGIPSSQSDQQR